RGVDVVLHLVLAAAGADVERLADGELAADDRPRHQPAVLVVEDDDVVFPLRVVVVSGVQRGGVGIGGVDDAVAVGVDRLVIQVVGVEQAVVVGVGIDDGGQREGADDEQVVVVVAFEAQLGLIGVNDE